MIFSRKLCHAIVGVPVAVLLFGPGPPGISFAEEPSAGKRLVPNLGGDIIFRLTYDGAYEAEAPRLETNDVNFEMIASPRLDFSDRFSIHSELRIEDIEPAADDRFFEDNGLFVRKLFATYDFTEDFLVRAGKFTPSFALASFVTPGMYGNSFNREIELIERVGFEAEYAFDAGDFGRQTVTASTFFDDTSILSDSIINSRGQNGLADGGASNTESFESLTVSLQGTDIEKLPGFTYKLGFIHEAEGEGDITDENGFAVAATQSIPLGQDKALTLIGEVAPVWNFEGSADTVVYSSAGIVFETGPWTFVLSGTHRWRDNASGENFNDYAQQTSAEYAFGKGFAVAVAHEFSRDENVNSQRVGVRLIKNLDLGP